MNDQSELAKLAGLDSLESLISALAGRHMEPGWLPRGKPPPAKHSQMSPAHWSYAEAKAAMRSAGRLVSPEQAERRNFVMRNPACEGDAATLRTLVCAYQSILPGEKARSHRHASHALRVILEARGSFSVVNGEKHPMESGDIVLTPGGSWHGHGHDGDEQAYWMDGLDVPLTNLLEQWSFEEYPGGFEPVSRHADRSPMRFTWSDTVASLAGAQADREGHFGRTIELSAPSMPSILLRVHRWPSGWRNRPYRHAANVVYVVMEGSGRSTLGDRTFEWSFGDTLAAPAWSRIEHSAAEDAVMFSMSDETLLRAIQYYRIEPMP